MKRWMKNTGMMQMLIALLMVILIMSVSNVFVYRNSISGIYEKMSDNNKLAVRSVIQSFDNSFQTMNQVIHAIHEMPYGNFVQRDGSIDMVGVYTMQNRLVSLVSSVDFLEDVIVIYDRLPLAITTKGTSSLEHLFQNKYRHMVYNAEFWQEYLRSKHPHKVFPAEEYTVTLNNMEKVRKRLMVVVSGNEFALSEKQIMLLVNVDVLMEQINRTAMIPGSSFIMLDPNKNVLFSTEKNWDLVEVLNEVYFNPSAEGSLTKENYEYHFFQSDYNQFIYINKVPYRFQNIDSVTQANLNIMLIGFLSAVTVAVVLSMYLNRPVKNILRLLGAEGRPGGGFRHIYDGVASLQSENAAMRRRLEQAERERRSALLRKVLTEGNIPAETEQELKQFVAEWFKHKQLLLAAVEFYGESGTDEPLAPDGMTAVLREALARDQLEGCAIHVRGSRWVIVLGAEQVSDKKSLVQRLRHMLQRLEQEELSGFSAAAAVSNIYPAELQHLQPAYQEAANALEYRPAGGKALVIDAEDLDYHWNLYFPFEQAEKLSHYLITGKTEAAVEIIQDTIQENVRRNVHRNQLEQIVKMMFYHMVRLADSMVDRASLHEQELQFLEQVEMAENAEAMERALVQAAEAIGKHGKEEPDNKLNPAFISQYIDLHYMESLYLDHMAEVTGTTPKYFSNYFKKTFGINFVEYLNKVRLSHARELLKDKHLTIGEIAERTGYLNSSTFTTTFKKYYGVSPSEYRKKLQE